MNLRPALATILLFLVSIVHAQNLLVLVPAGAVQSVESAKDKIVIWPPSTKSDLSRLQSIATGADWLINVDAKSFGRRNGQWQNIDHIATSESGFYRVREKLLGYSGLGVLAAPSGSIAQESMLIGQDKNGLVKPYQSGDAVVAMHDANAAFILASKWKGRAIVVEFEPNRQEFASRYWLYGAWPEGVPVPKLGRPGDIPARELLHLLFKPDDYKWVRPSSLPSYAAQKRHWRSDVLPLLALFGSLALVVGLVSAFRVADERRAKGLAAALRCCFLSVPALHLYCLARAQWGLWISPWWCLLIWISLCLIFELFVLAWPGLANFHKLFLHGILTLATLASMPAYLGPFSPIYGPVGSRMAGESLGVGILCAFVLLLGENYPRFKSQMGLVEWIAKKMSVPAGVGLALLSVYQHKGFSFAILNLLSSDEQFGKVNLAQWLTFLASPFTLSALTIFLLGSLLQGRFFKHQIHLLQLQRPLYGSAFYCSLGLFLASFGVPELLPAAVYLYSGTYLVGIHDALEEL